MSSLRKNIGLVIRCSDYRLWTPEVQAYLAPKINKILGVDAHDMLVLPGPDGLFRDGRNAWLASISEQAKFLITLHDIHAMVLLAHQDCAGHPVSDAQHDLDAPEAAKFFKTHIGFTGKTFGGTLIRITDTDWRLPEKLKEV